MGPFYPSAIRKTKSSKCAKDAPSLANFKNFVFLIADGQKSPMSREEKRRIHLQKGAQTAIWQLDAITNLAFLESQVFPGCNSCASKNTCKSCASRNAIWQFNTQSDNSIHNLTIQYTIKKSCGVTKGEAHTSSQNAIDAIGVSQVRQICQKSPSYMKSDLQKRPKRAPRIWKVTYKRDLKEPLEYEKWPTKET